ncbi:MAG: TldD/PmbA family protein [Acidobacteria bacterium]|nr:MAG: TldD/PmbA family protein [Acidobacteriota bacterium]
MKKDMLELCAWVIDQAKKAGANESRTRFSRTRSVEIGYRERKPETIKEATNQSLVLQLFVDGRFSSQSTADLRKPALTEFVSAAVTATRLIAKDEYRSLPDPKYYEGRATIDLKLADGDYQKWSPEQRHQLAKVVENACLEAGGQAVISVEASVRDSFSEQAAIASNGCEGYRETTDYVFFAELTAKDEGDRRAAGYDYAVSRYVKSLPDAAAVGRRAAERTLAMRGAKKLKTETLPVIIENRGVSRVLNGLISAMSGPNVQQKRSFVMDKKGQKVGSDLLTIVDDPLIVGGFGSGLYDNEGMATRKRTFLEAGVLKDFYIDWYYSRKLGCEPTIGGPTNLIIPPGKRSVEQIMKDLGRGILVNDFIGGNSNSTTGDFSVGIGGFLFENGKPTQTVAEMNVADNHLKFWTKLAEVANDPWPYGSWLTPSLVFKDVVVSGV